MDAKDKRLIIGFVALVLIVCSCNFWWKALFSQFIPWTKTYFNGYQHYIEFLQESPSFASVYFLKEVPSDSGEIHYYWHQNMRENYTAYSVVLDKNEYDEMIENRLNKYCEEANEDEVDSLVYIWQENQYLYVGDSGWYSEEKLDFINNVMQNAGQNQEYYFLVVVEYNTSRGICYSGVILNDTTHELIEFSTEMRRDITPYVRRLFWRYKDFYTERNADFFQEALPENTRNVDYYMCNDREDYKSGYQVMLSEEAYNQVKQERLQFYETKFSGGEKYLFTDASLRTVDLQELEQQRIDFLDEFLTAEEAEEYYFLCDNLVTTSWDYIYSGVLCNDETCEIIEFCYDGPMEYRYSD